MEGVFPSEVTGSIGLPPSHPVFRQRNGKPIDPTDLSKLYAIRCKWAGIPSHRRHVMPHYCASAMLECGMSSKRVASWLGHTHKNASGPFSSPN